MMKFPGNLWMFLVLGVTLTSRAQKCTISRENQNLVNTLSKGNLNFSINAYKSLANEENVFFSPFSISVAMAMVAVGAKGNTLSQMKDVLNLNEFQDDDFIDNAFFVVLDSICSNSNYTLSTANKIYIQNNFPVLSPFLNTVTNSYKSNAENIDFSANAESTINRWVEQQTKNNIKDLFKSGDLDPLTVLVLVNAIYFKGVWEKRFEKTDTKDESFTLSNGRTVSVPMMNIKERFKYTHNDALKSKILQLKYSGDRLAMFIILPDDRNGLDQLQQQLSPEIFNEIMQDLSTNLVIAKLPKFKLNYRKELNEMMKKLGMMDAFSKTSADFSGISKEGQLLISKVIHQAFVNVDEEGTTAAAATGVSIIVKTAAFNPPQEITFFADHPFAFVIYDSMTNLILFMGNVNNPKV